MKVVGFDELDALVGQQIALSDWQEITQDQVNLFAKATGDHQWIHVDVEKAKHGPFGGPIAHGFLTLSLLPQLLAKEFEVGNVKLMLNYGLNKVRFVSPVPVPCRIRLRLEVMACEAVDNNGKQITFGATFEREGSDKAACVAESLIRIYA